jgi:peptide/nickel transport system substrate-binding protein
MVVAAAGMVAAACGGGGKKGSTTSATTQPAGEVTTTSTTETVGEIVGAVPTSTTAPAAGGATPTTSRKTTATTVKRSTTPTTSSIARGPAGGITNVTSPPSTAPNKAITPGGTITWLKGGDIPSLDPIRLNNGGTADGAMGSMIYDLLVYTDPVQGTVIPQTAESLTSTDAVVWTLKLRPNIKFSDGTSYDAAAVKFNYQRMADPANAATRAANAQQIDSMDVIDATTLKITLKAKNAVFPQAISAIPFIGSPTAIQTQGATSFGTSPVGAGAFVLKSWQRDAQMVLVRNPSYWSPPRPYVDQVIVKPMTDEVQRINTVNTGQANFTFVQTPESVDRATDAGQLTYPQVINGGMLLYLNTRKAPFNDLRARQAVAMAIDLKDYAKVVNNGKFQPLDSIFRPDSPFYDPNILQLGYNPTKAQQLFDDLAAEKKPVEFTLASFSAINYFTSAQYIQGVLNKYRNVKVSVQQDAGTAHQQNYNSGNYQASNSGLPIVDPEPAWTSVYTCDANPSPTGWCSSVFDAAVKENRTTLDPARRIAVLKDAQREFYSQVPSLFLERRYNWLVSAPNFNDVEWVNDGLPLFDRIWIKR